MQKLDELISAVRRGATGATPEQLDEVEREIRRAASDPVLAFIGLSGVGKSTTINSLFNAGLPVSHFEPCTQLATPVEGDLYEMTGARGKVVVYDMPGLGESLKADERHYDTYRQVLPTVDAAIWVVEAPVRGMAPIQLALQRLRAELGTQVVDKIVFAINKVDRMYPGERDWNEIGNVPSEAQIENAKRFTAYVDASVREVVPEWKRVAIPYSAARRYRLQELMREVSAAFDVRREWLLTDRAAVADYRELVDPRLLQFVEQERRRRRSK
ncbi:GTPase [Mycolicibacterium fortuitum]|uniref:GTPase family protein n=1 Tax=Mycolicibacterium fortuitum TaxID=1766 RepID=UPI0034CF5918